MNPISAVSAFFSAIGEFFGWRKQRDANLNAYDVKIAAKGQEEADAIAQTENAIAKGDLNEIRKESAE